MPGTSGPLALKPSCSRSRASQVTSLRRQLTLTTWKVDGILFDQFLSELCVYGLAVRSQKMFWLSRNWKICTTSSVVRPIIDCPTHLRLRTRLP